MNSMRQLSLVSGITSLLIAVACEPNHESLGHDESGGSAGTTVDKTATGGAAAKQDTSVGTAGQGPAAGTSKLGNAFGQIGVDPSLSPYVRSTQLSPTATAEPCHTTSLTGTIDGRAIDQLYELGSSSGTGGGLGNDWELEVGIGETAKAGLSGSATSTIDVFGLAFGAVVAASHGFIVLPPSLPSSDRYVCVTGASSLEGAGNHMILAFSGVGYLPDCSSGTAVDGAIDYCFGCGTEVSGSIDGKTYASSEYNYSQLGQTFEADNGALEIRTSYVASSATRATLRNVWLTDKVTGNVYCAGAESYAEALVVTNSRGQDTYQSTFHFRGLRFAGNCSEASGSDTLVVRDCGV